MPRPLSISLLALVCLNSTAMADDKPSPAVQKIVDKSVAEVKRNLQTFRNANIPCLGTAKQELQDLATTLIQDGKSKEAQAVLKQVDTLEADVMRRANAPEPLQMPRPVPQRPLLERMAGKWGNPNFSLTHLIQPDGQFFEFKKTTGGRHSTGRIRPKTDEVAVVTLDNGWGLELRLSADGQVIACLFTNPQGEEHGDGTILRKLP